MAEKKKSKNGTIPLEDKRRDIVQSRVEVSWLQSFHPIALRHALPILSNKEKGKKMLWPYTVEMFR